MKKNKFFSCNVIWVIIGLKIKKWFGLFAEGEYSKLWDKKIYNAKVGFNVNFR